MLDEAIIVAAFGNQKCKINTRTYKLDIIDLPCSKYIQENLVLRYYTSLMGRDSSVGIATRYGLDDPGTETRRGRDFQQPSRPALRPTQPPIQWIPGLSRG